MTARRDTTQHRSARRRLVPRLVSVGSLISVVALVLALAGCGLLGGTDEGEAPADAGPASSTAPPASTTPPPDPDSPSGWGPTVGELEQAGALVDAMDDADRVATVMMPGFWGYDGESPTPAEAAQNQQMHGVDSPS